MYHRQQPPRIHNLGLKRAVDKEWLDSATDKLVLDIADYAALKAGTYTLATFTALATPGTVFDVVEKPTSGTLQYTATSIEYVVHPKTTVLVVKSRQRTG